MVIELTDAEAANSDPFNEHKQIQCEGNCPLHRGDVRVVHVTHAYKDFGQFNYCEAAFEEDTRRGLTVDPVIELTGGEAVNSGQLIIGTTAMIHILSSCFNDEPAPF